MNYDDEEYQKVKDAVTQNGLLGAVTGGLEASAGGITAAVIAGLLVALLFKRGDRTKQM